MKVASVGTIPETPTVGEKTSIVATVANIGDRISGPFNVHFYVEGPGGSYFSDHSTILELRDGDTKSVEVSWTPSEAGLYTITVAVDQENRVSEKNEYNNQMQVLVEVAPGQLSPTPTPTLLS